DHTGVGDAQLLAIHTDHLGRPQKLTDASQAVVWDGQFDPFGEEYAVASTTDMPLRFPGQEWDAMTALSQNWNRDYDPTLGRYIESDPIGLMGGVNRYAYASDNTILNVDPSGLWTYQVGVGISYGFWFGYAGTIGAGLAIDGHGNIAPYSYWGHGVPLGTGGLSGGVQQAVSNADDVCGLGGWFDDISLGGGWGPSATGDGFWGKDQQGRTVAGGGVTRGAGLGTVGFVGRTNTTIHRIVRVW
ncbi:MAG: RHS domain-containing protein, partial [Deltaproteobacteria bacterium]|nr:RHS domain-containing protein [Deltaproteobacteria bacterium]